MIMGLIIYTVKCQYATAYFNKTKLTFRKSVVRHPLKDQIVALLPIPLIRDDDKNRNVLKSNLCLIVFFILFVIGGFV